MTLVVARSTAVARTVNTARSFLAGFCSSLGTTWDDEEVEVASAAAVVPPHGAAATSTEACAEAAHSWEDLEFELGV